MTELLITRTNSTNPDFIKLVKFLDAELAIRDGNEHSFYAQYNKIDELRNVALAYNNGHAVGCGAFKKYEGDTAEIKRMYVLPIVRSKGIAGKILEELEKWATEEGFGICILETGRKQPEAVRLYEKSGYMPIPNYGQYEGIENSVCMKKILNNASHLSH